MAEFPEIGGAFNWADSQCFRPTLISSATGFVNLFLSVIFLVLVIVKIIFLIKGIKKEKFRFFVNFWNVLDILIVLLSLIGLGIWITKFIFTKKALALYADNKNVFINFQHIVVWEYIFNVVLGLLVFISTLRISSALGYNRKIVEIAYVLKYGLNDIISFSFPFIIVLVAFVMFGYLVFGVSVYEYRNMFVSFGSLANTLIGKNAFNKIQQTVPILGELFFFVYVFCVLFTLMTIFAAILNNTITDVRNSHNKISEQVGIMHIIKSIGKDLLGLVGIHVKRTKRDTNRGIYLLYLFWGEGVIIGFIEIRIYQS